MILLTVSHTVADYDNWKKVFDDFPKAESGIRFHRVNRDVEDPSRVLVVHGFEDADAAKAFVGNPELKSAMQQAGATSAPRIELFEELEAVQY